MFFLVFIKISARRSPSKIKLQSKIYDVGSKTATHVNSIAFLSFKHFSHSRLKVCHKESQKSQWLNRQLMSCSLLEIISEAEIAITMYGAFDKTIQLSRTDKSWIVNTFWAIVWDMTCIRFSIANKLSWLKLLSQ